ncbi:MAG: DnaD domain protein [Anaerolineales bacterium]|jgi:DnaD/phage-associated family protein
MASGFSDSETFAQIPDSFFRHLLSEVDDLDELKVTLYALWRIGNMEGRVHFLRGQDFVACIPDPGPALEKAVRRGSLLHSLPPASDQIPISNDSGLYFLNSPRGRAAAASFSQGEWRPDVTDFMPAAPLRPNIFKLYEENIGPLTPLIADAIRDSEKTYPSEWVAEALGIAVKNNKRNWKYVEAILHRWKEEGHAKKQDRRDAQEDGRRYAEGDYADFIEH